MMKMNLQLFAHKKGVGSTKNGQRFRVQEIRCEKSRRTVCKSRKHPLQTARNQDSPGCERRPRRR